jgi:hypothetical protein
MGGGVPHSAIDDVGTMVDHLFSFAILHCDLHEFFEGGVVAVVPVF